MKKVDVSELQGPLKDFFEQLSGKNGRRRFNEFKLWLKNVETGSIFSFLRITCISAQSAVTTSKKYFRDNGVVYMERNFEDHFLGLKVKAMGEVELAVYKLEEDSLDYPILDKLGEKAEISVSQFQTFLVKNRESSDWFIFYLRGKDGNLWVVRAHWSSDNGGWDVGASSIEISDEWDVGHRVVSLN